ncbi:MAG: hypothetical protein ABSC94_02415 [Polyangiaceae bacterium]
MQAEMAIGLAGAVFASVLLPTQAKAWQEAHEVGDDVTVHIDSTGTALVEHEIRWRVGRGPLRGVSLDHVDSTAVLEPEASISTDDGRVLAAHVLRDQGLLRVVADEPRSLERGTFTFRLRWRENLLSTGAIAPVGGAWRVTLANPTASDGFEGARTTLVVPSAPDPPVAIVAETGAIDDGTEATLRRGPATDTLELTSPHVARGSSTTWTVRVDPHAFGNGASPGGPASSSRSASALSEPDRIPQAALFLLLVSIATALAAAIQAKARAMEAFCARQGGKARPLLPVPASARACLGGAALALAIGLQRCEAPAAGSWFVALAVLLASSRAPISGSTVRGPGRWLALRPSDAFQPPPRRSDWLDIGTGAGRLTAAAVALVAVVVAAMLGRDDPAAPWLVAIDATPCIPLLMTGRACQLRPGARDAAPSLARAFHRLTAVRNVRVVPWGRIALDGALEELRLLVLPRFAMPGVVGIEIGVASSRTPVGWSSFPEILVRVLDVSAAAKQLSRWGRQAQPMPGRRPDERVIRVIPTSRSWTATLSLTRNLADLLADRRAAEGGAAWEGAERRSSAPPVSSGGADPGVWAFDGAC